MNFTRTLLFQAPQLYNFMCLSVLSIYGLLIALPSPANNVYIYSRILDNESGPPLHCLIINDAMFLFEI